MTISLSALSFEGLDVQHDNLIKDINGQVIEINTPLIDPESAPARTAAYVDSIKGLDGLCELALSMEVSGGVSQRDIQQYHQYKKSFPSLGDFLVNNPLGFFTIESSLVMYKESMESLHGAIAIAANHWIGNFMKSIWGSSQQTWNEVGAVWVANKKLEAKFDALLRMGEMISMVGVISAEEAALKPEFRRIHDERLQDLNRDIRENELDYMVRFSEYGKVLTQLTAYLRHTFPIVLNSLHTFVQDLNAVEDASSMERLEVKHRELLVKLARVDFLFKELATTELLKDQVSVVKHPTLMELQRLLANLPTTSANDAKGVLHPLRYNAAITDKGLYTPYEKDVSKYHEVYINDVLKQSRSLINERVKTKGNIILKSTTLTTIANGYFEIVEGLLNVTRVITQITKVRVSVIDKLSKVMLQELKQLDKWMMANEGKLSAGTLATYGKYKKQVWKAVNESRIT